MRLACVIASLFLTVSVLPGCVSSSPTAALDLPAPSNETTASIAGGPTPPGAVGDVSGLILAAPETYAATVSSQVPAQIAAPAPVEVAMVRPEKPAATGRSRGKGFDGTIYPARFSDKDPVDFGRASPKHFEVHGVDVSRWQGPIDWVKLRQRGANFAFIKATEGGKHVDPMFAKNWKAAGEAGVPRGAYHFFYWCRAASEQADWFIRNVPKEKGALPPVIDVEWHGNRKTCPHKLPRAKVLEKMKVFMDRLEAHYGQRPIIYTAPDFYEDNLKGQFKDYPFWLRSVAQHPKGRYPNRDFVFWQYSGTGLAKGHGTEIDLNVFNGSEAAYRKWVSREAL